MWIKNVINKSIQELEEKLQILKGTIGDREFKEISTEVDEIKRMAIDLPDDGYLDEMAGLVMKILKLEFGELSDSSIKEFGKEMKRKNFLDKLGYIRACIEEGKDASDIIKASLDYWNGIKGNYDKFEIEEVETKIDELVFEKTLLDVKNGKEVDLLNNNLNCYLIRDRLQEISKRTNISDEDKFLIDTWIGESIDIKDGTVDEKIMKKIVEDKKVLEILAKNI